MAELLSRSQEEPKVQAKTSPKVQIIEEERPSSALRKNEAEEERPSSALRKVEADEEERPSSAPRKVQAELKEEELVQAIPI